jgi:hypothetical protein
MEATAKLKDEYVVYTAHWDHLGNRRPNAKGDNIYNGALDNATGCASVLAIAEALSKLPATRTAERSTVFLFPTAENKVFSARIGIPKHPLFRRKNGGKYQYDGGNLYGLTTITARSGAERSTMMPIVMDILGERK